jgi:fibronectin type 3 domain-containing protein
VKCDNAGEYSVLVSNAVGTVSATNTLSVLSLQMYAGLTICGPIGAVYRIEYANGLDTNQWQVLTTNFVLTNSPCLFMDWDSHNQYMRIYRAITP